MLPGRPNLLQLIKIGGLHLGVMQLLHFVGVRLDIEPGHISRGPGHELVHRLVITVKVVELTERGEEIGAPRAQHRVNEDGRLIHFRSPVCCHPAVHYHEPVDYRWSVVSRSIEPANPRPQPMKSSARNCSP